MGDKKFWIGFSLVKGVGPVRMARLTESFGDLERAWSAPLADLMACGLGRKAVENLAMLRKGIDLDGYIEAMEKKGIKAVFSDSPDYPANLDEIEQKPPVLYYKGTITAQDTLAVGIVGTRKVTYYGKQVTEELSTRLAQSGATVVSGLARGVDAVAHQFALRANGRTLAVLGSGVDVIYPPEHRKLAEEIIENGALISDYPPGTEPDRVNFPPRNRIISGLSRAVVVVEAGQKSGALITANFAADQGRDTYAVPGSIYSPESVGTNALLANGANIYLGAAELLADLSLQGEGTNSTTKHQFDGLELALMEQLGTEPQHIDDICANAGIPVEKGMAVLTILELNGFINQVGVMNYVRNPLKGR